MHSIVGDAKSSDMAGCFLMRRRPSPSRAAVRHWNYPTQMHPTL
jgi:hypothetical protein